MYFTLSSTMMRMSSNSQVHVHMALHQVKSSPLPIKLIRSIASPSQVQVHLEKRQVPKSSQVQVHHILEYSSQVQVKSVFDKNRT